MHMIIKSLRLRLNRPIEIFLPDNNGNTLSLEQKDNIKYLGVFIDEKINWKYHISFICSRIILHETLVSFLNSDIFSHLFS